MFLVACWSCSLMVSGVAAPEGPLRSHITGGYKGRSIWYYVIELDFSCAFQVPKLKIADLIWTVANSAVIMTFSITFPFPL